MSASQSAAPLAGKTAFITGGSGGIGSASAEFLLRDGANVTLMGRRRKALEETRERLQASARAGARIEIIEGDSLKKDDVKAGIALAAGITGKLDICIPTVGGGAIRPLLLHDEDSFMADIDLNIRSAFLVIRHGAPVMAAGGGGSIVCISSDAAKLVFPWLPAYNAAKAALEALVRSAAEELSHGNVRVNAVRPGLTRTDSTLGIFANEETYKNFAEEKPLRRLGEPEDIAAGVRYLAGPESSWVTGQSFAIEGGNELRKAADLGPIVRQMFGEDVFAKLLKGIDPLPG